MEAIGTLTGGLAHDFNNLLSVIIGNLDLVRERSQADPASSELVGEALAAALRGADLTRRLLAFARKQPLQPRPIDVNELVSGLNTLLARTLGGNIEVDLRLGDGVWPVVADPAQLESSLINLATNARDAMPDGGTLRIATGNRELDADYAGTHEGLTPGDYALIEVSDTGTGIAPETLGQIFEPFFTTKEGGKGTGLGLSMVFGFMKQSGGHINVYSELGVGTTFRLYLPHQLDKAAAPAPAPPAAQLAPTGGGVVLVVEDNPGLRDLVVRQLTQLGYRCLEAGDGPSALRTLESETVDLVFTDVVMPNGMSGYDLGRDVRARWPAVKVLLTSGFAEEKRHDTASPQGGMRLLSKPYRKADLAHAIRDTFDGRP
jgi:CheY-like chemotaxis protein